MLIGMLAVAALVTESPVRCLKLKVLSTLFAVNSLLTMLVALTDGPAWPHLELPPTVVSHRRDAARQVL